jgi:trehalose-phosphatase
VLAKKPVWFFLDYDGTLSDFAPTPETIEPNQKVYNLLIRLSSQPGIHLAIISGRRLRDVLSLIPIKGIYLAGTYGIEILMPDGTFLQRVKLETVRPFLEAIKPKWMEIIKNEAGFYLEDKTWALALHAKLSNDDDAKRVLALAREIIERELPEEQFRILSGTKFLEVAPLLAHKGKAISFLLDQTGASDVQSLYIYIGDDERDEEAFEVINAHAGFSIKVFTGAQTTQKTRAKYTMSSPVEVNAWLETLLGKIVKSSLNHQSE